MRLPAFEYRRPATVAEACRLLAEPDARAVAGGTEVLVDLKQKASAPRTLVSVMGIPELDGIEATADGGLSIGPAATLHAVAASPLVKQRFVALAAAAGGVGRPRIPRMGTLGGNICLDGRCFYHNQSGLWKRSVVACRKDGGETCHVVRNSDRCHALFVADTVPTLIALGAQVTLAGHGGERTLPLEELYTGDGERVNVLEPGQLLTRVLIPAPAARSGAAHLKHSLREAIDFAVVNVGVVLVASPDGGVCRRAAVVLGSVASGPLRATQAEAALQGRAVDQELTSAAAQMAAEQARPISHLGIPAGHKRTMVETLTRRALAQAWQRATAAEPEQGEASHA